MQRTSSVKKHTRSVKETVVIYLLGVSICVYLGFLCGAVWISGNDFNEFMNNFQSFVIEGHHYIVESHLPHGNLYWLSDRMVNGFIIIFTRLSILLPERNMGRAKMGRCKELPDQFANHDEKKE